MLELLQDLMTSKKFTTSQLGILSLVAGAFGLPGDCKTIVLAGIALITASSVLAQGLADFGKEGILASKDAKK